MTSAIGPGLNEYLFTALCYVLCCINDEVNPHYPQNDAKVLHSPVFYPVWKPLVAYLPKQRGCLVIAVDTELKGSGFKTRTRYHLWLARGMLWSLVNPSWVCNPWPGWGAMYGEAQYHGYTYTLTNNRLNQLSLGFRLTNNIPKELHSNTTWRLVIEQAVIYAGGSVC